MKSFRSVLIYILGSNISCSVAGFAAVTAFGMEAESSPLLDPTSPVVSEASQDNNSTFQLLQAHGITMLPTDESTTVESAMESGQRVVLTGRNPSVLCFS